MNNTKNKEHSLKGKISDTKRNRSMVRHINVQTVERRSTNSVVDSRPYCTSSQMFIFRLHEGKPTLCPLYISDIKFHY